MDRRGSKVLYAIDLATASARAPAKPDLLTMEVQHFDFASGTGR